MISISYEYLIIKFLILWLFSIYKHIFKIFVAFVGKSPIPYSAPYNVVVVCKSILVCSNI